MIEVKVQVVASPELVDHFPEVIAAKKAQAAYRAAAAEADRCMREWALSPDEEMAAGPLRDAGIASAEAASRAWVAYDAATKAARAAIVAAGFALRS